MGMSIGRSGASGKSRAVPQMNVTPLVDVVLVLLIIFMVVTPLLSKQFWLNLPKENAEPAPPGGEKNVVLAVKRSGALEINGAEVPKDQLRDKIARVMAARSDKVLYFDAEGDAPYALTVEAMDLARQGGAKTIAILTKTIID